ncbi:MAG: type II toxin-antitoxin system HicB family antitoxin [Nitrospirae bacterium]|nr:type II toxin-antitoxin system HicB family antitoxin [Nitrospirota bacterium]MCL5977739.1 type II toxin-antitoxin system HicB family antitoxin [Nitrospirota bacterium]
MSTISLRLPDSLHETARELARKDRVSINQFIATALAEKISALITGEYLEERAKRGSRKKFEKAMAKVADVEPEEYDKL